MKNAFLGLMTVLCSCLSLSVRAEVTPVFVSCYSDDGAHLQLIFDTENREFSYRFAKDDVVEDFASVPAGASGFANSLVTTQIPADQNHIELRAHVVAGDDVTPIIDTDAEVIFDRDQTGAVKLTSYSLIHLSQAIDIDRFKSGSCYVQ